MWQPPDLEGCQASIPSFESFLFLAWLNTKMSRMSSHALSLNKKGDLFRGANLTQSDDGYSDSHSQSQESDNNRKHKGGLCDISL